LRIPPLLFLLTRRNAFRRYAPRVPLQIVPYSLVIFDLDGTLVDSFPCFLRTINAVADRWIPPGG